MPTVNVKDPQSHRVIEKRRRDRMNKCLQELSRLIPQSFTKKSKSRVEKTEIIEMAIKYLKHLNATQKEHSMVCREEHRKQFLNGFQESMSETIRFLVEVEEMTFKDGLCMRIVSHLQNHVSKLSELETVTQKSKSNVEKSLLKMSHSDNNCKQSTPNEKVTQPSYDTYKKTSSTYTSSSSNSAVSGESDKVKTNRKYKFKQNMKERFQADLNINDGKHETNGNSSILQLYPLRNSRETSSNSSDSSTTTSLSGGSNSTDKNSANSSLSTSRCESSRKDISSNIQLPGFVLHPSETYYIPIQLNISADSHILSENISNTLMFNLYPVNITVNFCYSMAPFEFTVTIIDTR